MRTTTRVALALAGSAALIGVTAVPSFAADPPPATSPVTVSVTPGTLSITAPTASTALTMGTADTSLNNTATVELGETKVTDMRAGTTAWTATVSLPDLVGTTTVTEIIATSDATYLVGTTTKVGTVTVPTPTEATGLDNATTPPTSLTVSAVDGNNSVAWPSDLTVVVPSETLVEEYTGTVTQSVS